MKYLIWLLLPLLLNACLRSRGTDTGNPGIAMGTPDSGNDSSQVPGLEIQALTQELCLRIQVCEQALLPDCESGILEQSNIDTEIGLQIGEYETLEDASADLEEGRRTASRTVFNICINETRALSCDDPRVEDAFQPGLNNPYENVAGMIPQACQNLIEPEE